MFIQERDYKVVCGDEALEILMQSDEDTRLRAERVAMEEVASYIRPRYDINKAFAAWDDERNPMLIQVTVNIALYYMVHWLPQNLGIDAYKELYDGAIDWLTRVAKGTIMPDLPTYVGENGETDVSNPMRFGGMKASQYDY